MRPVPDEDVIGDDVWLDADGLHLLKHAERGPPQAASPQDPHQVVVVSQVDLNVHPRGPSEHLDAQQSGAVAAQAGEEPIEPHRVGEVALQQAVQRLALRKCDESQGQALHRVETRPSRESGLAAPHSHPPAPLRDGVERGGW
eukprot:9472388-Pyramimonas_sp.AAC.2